MRVMALDLGERRVGVALSDESRTLATPYQVLQRKSFAGLVADLQHIAHDQNVNDLVIGVPYRLDGQLSPQVRHIIKTAERIHEQIQLPMTLWDESLSTIAAEQLLEGRKGRRVRGRRRPTVDAMAAAVILQEFLDSARAGTHTSQHEG